MAFSKQTFAYLADLEANNTKEWFEANRDRYEKFWKAAALDFIASISDRMTALSPSLRAEAKLNGSLRRINRDVRFSKDKSPYSARLHLVFWTGDHPNRSPAMHFVLSPGGVGYGAGQWGIDPSRLKVLRDRIVDPADGAALVNALECARSVGCRMGQPDLARVPKGYSEDGQIADLLRYKGFVARTHESPARPSHILGDTAINWALTQTDAMLPLIRWLAS